MSKFNTFKEGVKLVALLQASLEQMDELKGTVLYKQKLKQQLGNTEKMLERALTNPLAALDNKREMKTLLLLAALGLTACSKPVYQTGTLTKGNPDNSYLDTTKVYGCGD